MTVSPKADVADLLDRVCDHVAERIDAARIAEVKRRQAAMFAGRARDVLPIIPLAETPETAGWPDFDWAEQFYNPAASLYQQLKDEVLPRLAGGGDCLPAVRPDTGVINCMTVFGAAYDVPAHTRPVITRYVPKDDLVAFEPPDDVSDLGCIPTMREHAAHHRQVLQDRGLWEHVRLAHCDVQGPWDIAAQARGHDLFMDLYEDPDFVQALLAKCAAVCVAVTRLCKTFDPSPVAGGAGSYFWMDSGVVRLCDDSGILISADQHRTFAAPYMERALDDLGGGWIHYCGGMPDTGRKEGLHLHEVYAGIDGCRGLNWTTGGDWLAEMRRLHGLGLCHVGTLSRDDGEPLDAYFRRALSVYPDRTGLIFDGPDLRPGEADRAVALWRDLQEDGT